MKRITHISIVLAALVITGITSCNKMLDKIQPTDQVSSSTIYSSLSDLNEGVLGVYSNWDEEYIFQIGSMMADECKPGLLNSGNNGVAVNLYNWTYSSQDQNVINVFQNPYQVINRANLILNSIDQVPGSKQLKGELLAIRAFEHFELYRTFSNSSIYTSEALAIPYITTTNIENKPSRPTTANFMVALQNDIAEADSLMAPGISDNTRMSQVALQALQARIALYTGNWANAITFSTDVINSVPLASISEFPYIWTDQSDAEVIFKIRKTNQSLTYPEDIFKNIAQGIILFTPSNKLISAYDTSDIRPASYFVYDSSLAALGYTPPYDVYKYAGSPGQQNITDEIVFRTSEMYLIRAEAYAMQGNTGAAQSDLNTLRANRIRNYVPQTFNGSSILPAILNERFKELAYEGHRYYDLRRQGDPIQRNTDDLQDPTNPTTLTPTATAYLLPIPQLEVEANPNILPNNKGW